MKHLVKRTHPVYDNQLKWGTYGIWEQPVFDVEAFQSKIDAIVGTSLGQPIVRLVWAWDKRCREAYFTKWDLAGNGIELEFEYKYRFAKIPIGNGDTTDICPPRWILEQRYEPGQYAPSWEASRWAEKDIGKRHTCNKTDDQRLTESCNCPDIRQRVELKPPPPADGWYQFLWTIAEHESNLACCERLPEESRRHCYGYYRLPLQKDLDRLQRAVKLRDQDKAIDPHKPMPQDVLAEIHRAAFASHKEEERLKQAESQEIFRDTPKLTAHKRFVSGGWQDLKGPYTQTDSGLYIPQ